MRPVRRLRRSGVQPGPPAPGPAGPHTDTVALVPGPARSRFRRRLDEKPLRVPGPVRPIRPMITALPRGHVGVFARPVRFAISSESIRRKAFAVQVSSLREVRMDRDHQSV
jgi:hypothetical protein